MLRVKSDADDPVFVFMVCNPQRVLKLPIIDDDAAQSNLCDPNDSGSRSDDVTRVQQ